MAVDRKYQLDNNSRKQYIEAKIIPYIPAAFKEGYIERISAVVDMYAGSDAEVISIIEDAVGKDSKTNQCLNLEMILLILVANSNNGRVIALKECCKVININHSQPKRMPEINPIIHHERDKEKLVHDMSYLKRIDEILAYCA